MSEPIRLEFQTLPSMGAGYLRALYPRKRGLRTDATLPAFEARIAGVRIDAAKLAAYRECCGFPADAGVPITYPQVLAGPIHIRILTHPKMPIAALGIVHMRNAIVQHAPIAADAPLDFTIRLDGNRWARKGVEFDILTEATVNGAKVWESVMTIFSRQRVPEGAGAEAPADALPRPDRFETWRVPADQGRRYASVSGDYNLIHLYPWTAKMFGFPRQIVHGMWSLARCAAAMPAPAMPSRLSVDFRRPVLLPATVRYGDTAVEGGTAYALMKKDEDKPYLVGCWVKA
jgi:acyl dehydratase